MKTPIEQAELPIHLQTCLEPIPVDAHTIESQFMQRQPRKITALKFLIAFIQSILYGEKTDEDIAVTFGLLNRCTVSRQAIGKRFNESLVRLLERILACVLALRTNIKPDYILNSRIALPFQRILVKDSTIVKLHESLAKFFPGSRNGTSKQFAQLRIQAVIDIMAEKFCHFYFSPFTRNDQRAAKDILRIAKAGDLLIWDLGYFCTEVLKELFFLGVAYISRLRYGVSLYKADGETPFRLLLELKRKKYLDVDLYIGQKAKAPVRLVACPVPQDVHQKRKEKALKNRDRRCNPSKEHLALLGWNIFITTVPRSLWSIQDICEIYGVRWRIEIVFKAWKSHFKLEAVPQLNHVRVRAHILAVLIYATLFQTQMYVPLYNIVKQRTGRELSLLKTARFIARYWPHIVSMPQNQQTCEFLINLIAYYCSYDKRTRKSYPQFFDP